MKRRELLCAAAALAAAFSLHAQAPRKRRIGIALPGSPAPGGRSTAALARLAELGWREGHEVEYVYGYAHGESRRWEQMFADLLAQKPDVMLVAFGSMAVVARKLTQDVPIVFVASSNPEKSGVVASLARPGGNVTGVSTREIELLGKRIELLREITPGIRRVAVLVNSNSPDISKAYLEGYSEHAKKLGMQIVAADARSEEELRSAFDRMSRERAQGLLGIADPVHIRLLNEVVAHAARLRLTAIYVGDEFVEAGGLASYGTDRADQWRRGAVYVDKILRGAKPADLPVQEPTNFLLAVNLKSARTQGFKFPQSVLVRANRVIE